MAFPRKFSAFLNDPGGIGDVPEVSEPGASAERFSIPGLPEGDDLSALVPGTPEFQASHLYVILTHAYDVWADYFGKDFDWYPGKVLAVNPRAGYALNASYDRTALNFFYAKDARTGRMLYTCESSDVAAHECGHAILDAHHPDYWSSFHPETAAFHEAFGDITALLTTLGFPSVRERMLRETNGDLRKTSNVTRLAEDFGRALYLERGKDFSGATFLRDLVNTFRYQETWNLPATAPSTRLSSESHSFSRIFSGAFYQILVGIFEARRKAGQGADDALVMACDDVGRLMANALLLAPPGDAVFRVIATSMFKAEQQLFRGMYFEILKKVFVNRRIVRAQDANVYRSQKLQANHIRAAYRSGIPVMASMAAEMKPPPAELQRALRLRGNELIFSREMARGEDEKVVQYRAERLIPLKGKQFGPANGAWVPLHGGITLNVDPQGLVEFSGFYSAGVQDVKAVRDHVVKLAERETIADTSPTDEAEVVELVTRRQPYFIEHDERGNKILRRAFITCARHC